MNRNDLQELARQRLREARALLRARFPGGAYYLAGYAVECALKACIARKTQRFEFPDKQTVDKSYTHNLVKLVGLAGLKEAREQEEGARAQFGINWTIVKDWKEDSRYDRAINVRKARDLYRAITSRNDGVWPWVRRHW